jgi:hypothetical protein
MKDPKRIERLLIEFKKVWERNPDLRFFQVIELIKARLGKVNSFYLEDDHFVEFLKKL